MAKTSTPQRRTAEEWSEMVDEWKASGRSAEDFAENKGVSESSLYTWRKRLRDNRAPLVMEEPQVGFVPVVVEDEVPPTESIGWRIQTRTGVVVSMNGPGAFEGLEVAIRVLGERGAL